MTETKTRKTRTFSWACVNPTLVRRLLDTVYQGTGQVADAKALRSMSPAQLNSQATRALGRPPSRRTKEHPDLLQVLIQNWLPRAQPDPTGDLVYQLNAYKEVPRKADRIAYLGNVRGRRREELPHLVWRAFVAAHKEEREVSSSRTTAGAPLRSRIELVGAGTPSPYREPYDHQVAAWKTLDSLARSRGRRAGLLEIPTGGGKTATAVTWIIQEMVRRPDLRVLWLADQQELVEQAARAFEQQSLVAPTGFRRTLRVVHGGAAAASVLADPEAHVICATRQSIAGRGFDAATRMRLRVFLERPTVVVVDEAHHSVSPTYQQLLTYIEEQGRWRMLLGLTATPWPAGYGRTQLLRETFPTQVVSVRTDELVQKKQLAAPVVHTLATQMRIDVTEDERRRIAGGGDLPESVARKLDQEVRNRLIVKAWVERRVEWGKTLVFACDIGHAEALSECFREEDVRTDVVHSGVGDNRRALIQSFRTSAGPRVLVSVGMLLEGVDIPDARTAFLCRPTGSRIVMRQMIGRVLRGPSAGGDAHAHIVDFVDQWSAQVDILRPVDIPHTPVQDTDSGVGDVEHLLPPVIAEDGETEVPRDLIRSISHAMAERVRVDGMTPTLSSSRLVGFYDLDIRRIPVFENTREPWLDVVTWALRGVAGAGSGAQAQFDDVPPPTPHHDEVVAFVEHCRSTGEAPVFFDLELGFDARAVAKDLVESGPMAERERMKHLRQVYDSSLARGLFPNLQTFIEKIEQEKLALLEVIPSGSDPESLPRDVQPGSGLIRPRRSEHRRLEPVLAAVIEGGTQILGAEPAYLDRLAPEVRPAIKWSDRHMTSMWAHWSWRRTTRAKGKPRISVNRALMVTEKHVPDGLLAYLIWHELCHHLTPGQGHSAEFRRLEALWPDQMEWGRQLDSLHERLDLLTPPRK